MKSLGLTWIALTDKTVFTSSEISGFGPVASRKADRVIAKINRINIEAEDSYGSKESLSLLVIKKSGKLE